VHNDISLTIITTSLEVITQIIFNSMGANYLYHAQAEKTAQ